MEAGVSSPDDDASPTYLIGKRYEDVRSQFELLCVRAGRGPLEYDGVELTMKTAKQLPASD